MRRGTHLFLGAVTGLGIVITALVILPRFELSTPTIWTVGLLLGAVGAGAVLVAPAVPKNQKAAIYCLYGTSLCFALVGVATAMQGAWVRTALMVLAAFGTAVATALASRHRSSRPSSI